MGDRAVYCARLESVCAEKHPGFESLPIRHASEERAAFLKVLDPLLRVNGPPRQHLEILTQLYHAGIRQYSAKIHARIYQAIAA